MMTSRPLENGYNAFVISFFSYCGISTSSFLKGMKGLVLAVEPRNSEERSLEWLPAPIYSSRFNYRYGTLYVKCVRKLASCRACAQDDLIEPHVAKFAEVASAFGGQASWDAQHAFPSSISLPSECHEAPLISFTTFDAAAEIDDP
eukprot:2825017-Pleurochrysis_carterae.AAC.2